MGDKIKDEANSYVWYACYGSNMLYERFMCYIKGGFFKVNGRKYDGCSDKSEPRDVRPYEIKHNIYFAMKSSSWNNKGVAFLDYEHDGHAYGRMYLITREQYEEVWEQEGPCWYDQKVKLGECDGYPILTFTHSTKLQENEPSERYLEVIRSGMREAFGANLI